MCNHQVLIQNTHGYVIRCRHCGTMQFAFGTLLTNMPVKQFLQMVRDAEAVFADCGISAEPLLKQYVIPVDQRNMLCLNAGELTHLQEMLAGAAALLETYRILEEQDNSRVS